MDKTLEALVAAAEKYAARYDGDDRQDIKTDVLNAFYAGAQFATPARQAAEGGEAACPYVVAGREGTSYCRLNGPPPSAAEGWQPIETAPKDGTEIILGAPAQVYDGRLVEPRTTVGHWMTEEECRIPIGDCGGMCHCTEYEYEEPFWLSWDGGFTAENPPTKWMPMPPPPLAARPSGGGEVVGCGEDKLPSWRSGKATTPRQEKHIASPDCWCGPIQDADQANGWIHFDKSERNAASLIAHMEKLADSMDVTAGIFRKEEPQTERTKAAANMANAMADSLRDALDEYENATPPEHEGRAS